MSDENAAFVEDRDTALLSMDYDTIMRYMRKYGISIPPPGVFWIAVHKARSGAQTLPLAARQESVAWLTERGYTHLADDL